MFQLQCLSYAIFRRRDLAVAFTKQNKMNQSPIHTIQILEFRLERGQLGIWAVPPSQTV